jgi:large conductance mechanosensitive channel
MLQGFKQFMLRGNVLDLAVAVVMGTAFGAVVAALVKDLITPLIAAIVGKPDFSAIEFTLNASKFLIVTLSTHWSLLSSLALPSISLSWCL